jgi:hypothetical protein
MEHIKNNINNYNEQVGCDLVKNIYNTNYNFGDIFNNDSPYKYPALIITGDKLDQQNADIYGKYMDHGTLVVNNDDACKVDFNVRNLNNATNLQTGYARNIDLDSELKRINHITDKCYYDNYKYHPEEAPAGNGLYCHKKTLVNNYEPVGKPGVCAQPLDGQTYKSAILPGHLQAPQDLSTMSKKMSDNKVSYGYHTTDGYAPTERLNYQGCSHPRPEPHKCQVRPFAQFQRCDNGELDNVAKKLLEYKNGISGNTVNHYKFNGDINNQTLKFTREFPCQRLFNNNTKRSTLRNFHNLYDINPEYLS